ncbi:hypothetical protein ACFQL4_16580 [Halosimplex aquaticum]
MTAPFVISGFADEIASDLDDQLSTLESLDIDHLDLRGVWDENALDLSDERLDELEATLDERGFSVTSIGSPIGKIGVEDDFEPHVERLDRAPSSRTASTPSTSACSPTTSPRATAPPTTARKSSVGPAWLSRRPRRPA